MRELLPRRYLGLLAVVSLLILAAGWLLARWRLPEWGAGPPANPVGFARQVDAAARRARLSLEPSDPDRARVSLVASPQVGDRVGSFEGAALLSLRPELEVRVDRWVRLPGGGRLLLEIYLDPQGEVRGLRWQDRDLLAFLSSPDRWKILEGALRQTAGLLLREGERLEKGVEEIVSPGLHQLAISGGSSHLVVLTGTGAGIARRMAGALAAPQSDPGPGLGTLVVGGLIRLLLGLGVVVAFFIFLARGRIDLINGAYLGALTFLLLLVDGLPWKPGVLGLLEGLLYPVALGLAIFILWSTAESWFRSASADGRLSLDTLRAGRLGPRIGQALLLGVSLGAALAGLRLMLLVVAVRLPWTSLTDLSVSLPVWGARSDPITGGVLGAGAVVIAAAFCREVLPRAWVPAAVVLAALAVRPLALAPDGWEVLFSSVLALASLLILRSFGVTTLWAASIAAGLWSSAFFAAAHAGWLLGALVSAAALLAGATLAGVVGLGRPESEELRGVGDPAFLRRLEKERRTRYEMGLLARMQVGLLPETVPQPDGWEISARSILASEVGGDLYDFLRDEEGRLWVAAGDVAGHGYSCAISQAMTKAALASLVQADRSPGEVLERIDRVLRTARSRRSFTSLLLLRLEPETGEILLANAGHPYPMLFRDERVEEIAVPGLPLGQGPRRDYPDHSFRLMPGEVLAMCSDGLFEAVDRAGDPLGFERPRETLRKGARWSSSEILEMLVADWRRHRDRSSVEDDTTVVVVKRSASLREPPDPEAEPLMEAER